MTPSITVSVTPPARRATTGLPAAIASTGAIPKSSLPGHEVRVASSEQVQQAGPIHTAQEVHGRAGQRLQARALGAVADDHELATQPGARLDGVVEAPVGEHTRRHQEEPVVASERLDVPTSTGG